MALNLLMQFRTYLRPGEMARLKVKQLVPPALTAGAAYSSWGLLLHPVEDRVPGKTGLYDEAVVYDTDVWAYAWFQQLVLRRHPKLPLLPFSSSELICQFKRAVQSESMPLFTPA